MASPSAQVPHTPFGHRTHAPDPHDPRTQRIHPETPSFLTPERPAAVTYPFTTVAGRAYSAALTLRPVWRLGRPAIVAQAVHEDLRAVTTGHRLEAWERQALDPRDVERLDCEAYQRGLTLLIAARARAGIIATTYRTVACAEPRLRYLVACLEAPITERTSLIAELTGVDALTPPDRLAEAVTLISAGRRGVLVRAPADIEALQILAGISIRGVCFDVNGAPPPPAVVAAARAVAPLVLLDGLQPSAMERARALGATHAILAAEPGAMH